MKGDITRPLKAPTQPVLDFASLQHILDEHGMYASDKEDGIRCLIHPRLGPVSGQMKPIPNLWVRDMLMGSCPSYLDGELVAIDCEGNDADFNDTQSAIMTVEGQPSFEFRVFDSFENIYDPYERRKARAFASVVDADHSNIKWLPHKLCESVLDIERLEKDALRRGKEGIMLNHPRGWYKEGRSTFKEAYLLKVKRFTDDEAIVIGIEEEMENCNVATRNERGLQQRSKHQANLKGKGCVGILVCRWRKHIIKIGSGMTNEEKYRWWNHQKQIVGKIITFKYQAHGMKVLPRAPIFKGIRYD